MSGRKPKKALGRGLASLLGESVPLSSLRQPSPAGATAGAPSSGARRAGQPTAGVPPTGAPPAGAPTAAQPTAGAAESADGMRVLGIDELQPGEMQPRQHFDAQEIADLARSIKRQGVLQPLLVRPLARGGFEIVAGERRWRAAQKAQLHRVPVVVRRLNAQEALEIALVENVQRTDLNPMEESQAFHKLIARFGYTQESLAEAVGKSRPYITNSLRLQKLEPQVQAHLRAGRLSAGAARALIGRPNAAALAQAIMRRGLTVRQVEALAAKGARARPKAKPALSPDLRALERQLSESLGMEVQLKPAGAQRGRLIVTYQRLAQLAALLRRASDQTLR